MRKVLFSFLLVICFSSSLFAHRVNIFAYKEGNRIITESYFGNGEPTKNAQIKVYGKEERLILTGETDEEGLFSFFLPPGEEELKIVLLASMGHRAETTISIGEISSSPDTSETEEMEAVQTVDEKKLKSIVNEAVDRAVAPIIKLLEEEKRRIRFMDIVGGIGYILGILGIAFYFYKRKK